MPNLILHEDPISANCYKIRLTAAHVGIPLERRAYDILSGATRTASFLESVNPNGRIPVLQIGDDYLPESGAACLYLADGSPLIPHDRFDRADMLHWMFWEQYNHEPTVATVRFWRMMIGEDKLTDQQRQQLPVKQAAGEAALALMDAHLAQTPFMCAGRFTVADIALYAYTHVAEQGAFALRHYSAVTAWLARVASQPNHIAM